MVVNLYKLALISNSSCSGGLKQNCCCMEGRGHLHSLFLSHCSRPLSDGGPQAQTQIWSHSCRSSAVIGRTSSTERDASKLVNRDTKWNMDRGTFGVIENVSCHREGLSSCQVLTHSFSQPSIRLTVHLSIYPSISQSIVLPSTYPSIHPCILPSFHPSIYHPSMHPFVHPCIQPASQPSVLPSQSLFI